MTSAMRCLHGQLELVAERLEELLLGAERVLDHHFAEGLAGTLRAHREEELAFRDEALVHEELSQLHVISRHVVVLSPEDVDRGRAGSMPRRHKSNVF